MCTHLIYLPINSFFTKQYISYYYKTYWYKSCHNKKDITCTYNSSFITYCKVKIFISSILMTFSIVTLVNANGQCKYSM